MNENAVISKLDNINIPSFYWAIVILATLGGFLFGYDTSNIGSTMTFMPFYSAIESNSFVYGYLVAGASLGAAVGALIAAGTTERVGRKGLLIADAAIYAIGAIGSALSYNVAEILIFRTFIGIAVGADTAIATTYVAEFAPKKKRAHMTVLQQWMVTVGILGAYMVGMAVYFIAPSMAFSVGWRILLGVAAIPALIGLFFRFRMPESPRWLIYHEKFDRALASLKKLNIQATKDEVMKARDYLLNLEKTMSGEFTKNGINRALLIAGLFAVFTEITGINIPFYYGPVIISSLHLFPSVTNPALSMAYSISASAILGAINVAATYIGFKLLDTTGRRTLALYGFAGMTVFGLLGMTLALMHILIGILIGFAGFIIFFAFGVGANVWVIQSEYFPIKNKGFFVSIIAAIDWIANFVIVEVFPTMDKAIGIGFSMGVFAILSLIGFIIFFIIMPVSKGRSLEEMAVLLSKTKLSDMRHTGNKSLAVSEGTESNEAGNELD